MWLLFGTLVGLIVIGALAVIETSWLIGLIISGIFLLVASFAFWQKNLFVVGFVAWYFLTLGMTSFSSQFTFANTCKIASDCFTYTIAGPTWTQELFGWFVPFLGEANLLILSSVITVLALIGMGWLLGNVQKRHCHNKLSINQHGKKLGCLQVVS